MDVYRKTDVLQVISFLCLSEQLTLPFFTANPEVSRYASCFLDHTMPSYQLLLFLSISCSGPLKSKAFLEMEGILLLYSDVVNAKILLQSLNQKPDKEVQS